MSAPSTTTVGTDAPAPDEAHSKGRSESVTLLFFAPDKSEILTELGSLMRSRNSKVRNLTPNVVSSFLTPESLFTTGLARTVVMIKYGAERESFLPYLQLEDELKRDLKETGYPSALFARRFSRKAISSDSEDHQTALDAFMPGSTPTEVMTHVYSLRSRPYGMMVLPRSKLEFLIDKDVRQEDVGQRSYVELHPSNYDTICSEGSVLQ